MIDLEDYFDRWMDDAPEEHINNALVLLEKAGRLEGYLIGLGLNFPDNPKTGNGISGTLYGGYRPQDCGIGKPRSAHKIGMAVDRFDPRNEIDLFLYNDEKHHLDRGTLKESILYRYGIFIEHPSATTGWSHWSTKQFGSYIDGKTPRWFFP